MAGNNLNSMPLEIKLQILRHLLITDPAGYVLYVEPMSEDKKRCEGHFTPRWEIQPAILHTSKTLYLAGVEVLYGCNTFKFHTARTLNKFIGHINQSRLGSLSRLIRRLLLIATIKTTWEAEEWTSCLTGGLVQKNFPNLRRASVFLSHTGGNRFSESTGDDHLLSKTAFMELGAAFKNNMKAESIYFDAWPPG
ncbi:hypothetical protein MMC17_004170 [Xylographa soralifera]|nr:hypothetical protein [Xylographa soralifera]